MMNQHASSTIEDNEEFSVVSVNEEPLVLDDGDTPNPVAKKRRKLGTPSADLSTFAQSHDNDTSTPEKDTGEVVEQAKKKLSKWAARLFDPDRPRGLIEPPQTIPLNDEFLTAFGKREKEYDQAMGRQIDIDNSIVDEDDSDSSIDAESQSTKKASSSTEGRKLKISNIAYVTEEDTLRKACESYGPSSKVNLIMDKEKPDLNVGRAYVTFETPEAANVCMNELKTLDGRKLRIEMAIERLERPRNSLSAPARYWEKDISTKCFRCGQVGHMASSCPNEAIQKPCPLCATTGHEMFVCPLSKICFNCGVPGHINRDCLQRRGLPRRMVCGTCFESGHHRVNCRRPAYSVNLRDAKCMVCGERGHLMCRDMKWFFGLEGVSCFNCGERTHHGYDCRRPGLDECKRDPQLAKRQVEMASGR